MSLLPVDLGHQNGQAAMYLRRLNGLWSSQSFRLGWVSGLRKWRCLRRVLTMGLLVIGHRIAWGHAAFMVKR